MKVVICGAGRVGSTIAQYLSEDDNEVVVIDTDESVLDELAASMDVQPVSGFASHPSVLEAAGAQDADMLIAVTPSDEVNMITCQAANALFNVPTKIARIRSAEYADPKWLQSSANGAQPIDVIISPESEIARSIRRSVRFPGAFDVIPLASDRVRLIGLHCDEVCPMLNTPLRQLTLLFPDLDAIVVGVIRNGRLIIADGDMRLAPGDDVYLVAGVENVSRIMALFGFDREKTRSVLILGGGDVSLNLAQRLEKEGGLRISLIEQDESRAKFLAETLTETTVIHGDFLDTDILEEADIDVVETVIALSSDDENNILASLMAKKYGAEQTLAMIDKPLYAQLVVNLGVDVVIDPKDIMVSTILQHVRRGKIYAAYSVRSGMCEVLEADAFESFEYTGSVLRDVRLPQGVIIGAIVRDGVNVPLRGDTVIENGDRLVLFADSDSVKQVEKLFSVGMELF